MSIDCLQPRVNLSKVALRRASLRHTSMTMQLMQGPRLLLRKTIFRDLQRHTAILGLTFAGMPDYGSPLVLRGRRLFEIRKLLGSLYSLLDVLKDSETWREFSSRNTGGKLADLVLELP